MEYLDQVLTVAEVATLRGVTKQAVHKAMKDDKLTYRRVGKLFLITRSSAEEWQIIGNRRRRREAESS